MSLFDSFSAQLPKIDTSLPGVDLQSFLPDLSTGGDVFGSFNEQPGQSGSSPLFTGGGFGTSFQNAFTRQPWQSFLPSNFGTGISNEHYPGRKYPLPWELPPSPAGTVPGNTGGVGVATGAASRLNAFAGDFAHAGAIYGIDPNVLMAIATIEDGYMERPDQYGAIGIMQIIAGGYPSGEAKYPNWQTDARQNILLGAYILADKIRVNGSLDRGVMGYLGFGTDAYGTTPEVYLARFKEELRKLQASAASTGNTSGYTGSAGGYSSIFGGMSFGISSENGQNNGMPASWYGYGQGLGLAPGTHPGIDVTAPAGTRLHMPAGQVGVVEIADGTHYGYDPNGGVSPSGPQTGQLRIRFPNGSLLILGHMQSISVRPGQEVRAGDFLGYSGTAGSGAHVHMEFRIKDPSTSSGYRSVDPRRYL